ncbi:MAG TPA: TetR/AcrR family transcriptional regulator [Jatrophihabitans sp.]|jgi:AcrR family transcriptional regulator
MTAKRRTQTDRSAATRDALVQVARERFAEHGYGGVGTEAIVRAAGVTRGALYHQFADKTELFAAVVEAVEADVMSRIDVAVATSGLADVIDLMKLGADTWLDACSDPSISRIMLVDAPSVLGWERWREIGLKYGMGMVQALLAQAMTMGRIVQQPVAPLAHVLIGALDEATLYVVRHADRAAALTEVRSVLRALIDAFAVGADQ